MAETTSEYLTTRELAALLRLKERKIYDLAASGRVPCSRATGKLLFPRDAIHQWLADNSSGLATQIPNDRASVFLGSHDPLLEWALRESRASIANFFDGSFDGLGRFENGEGIATGLHIYDAAGDRWNVHIVKQRLNASRAVLIEWAWRDRGLIVTPGTAHRFDGLNKLKGSRFAPRQAEAGSQNIFNQLLKKAGLKGDDLQFLQPARSESDAALAVLEGKADLTFGLRSFAEQYKLDFVPVIKERFDLLITRREWFEPPMQTLIDFCGTEAFRTKAEALGGYDISGFGGIHYNCP